MDDISKQNISDEINSMSIRYYKDTKDPFHLTTFMMNLAMLLSTARINGKPLKVLLVDMHWADSIARADLFEYTPSTTKIPTIVDWAKDINEKLNTNVGDISSIKYSQEEIEQYMICCGTGLNILATPEHCDEYANIKNKEQIAKIMIKQLKENCNVDFIIFDCGDNWQIYHR